MSLGKGFNAPGSVGMGDLCAFLSAVGINGIVLGDVDNSFILSRIPQGLALPSVASSILYIENGKLVYGPASNFTAGAGTVTGTDILPLSNAFTGLTNTFQGNIIVFGTAKLNLNALATASASSVVLDGNSILRTVPLFTRDSFIASDINFTGNVVFNQGPSGLVRRLTVATPTFLTNSDIEMPLLPRSDTNGVYTVMMDAAGRLWKAFLGSGGGGGGSILPLDNTFLGKNTFGDVIALGAGLFSNGTINNQGPLLQQGTIYTPNLPENNNPAWVVTLNPNTSYLEKTALERGTIAAVVNCTNITVGYASTLSPSVSRTTAPVTGMGDSLLPSNTIFSPNGAGRTVKGTVYIPNVKVVASGTTFFHIHVWANGTLVESYVEPSNATVHAITFPFVFTAAQGANPIVIRFAVEYSSGSNGVVTFNESANAKYQPIVIFEELLQG